MFLGRILYRGNCIITQTSLTCILCAAWVWAAYVGIVWVGVGEDRVGVWGGVGGKGGCLGGMCGGV